MSFVLHERLAQDCVDVCDLPICKVLLMNDARFPWLILVPRRPDLRDLHEIAAAEQAQVFTEITRASQALEAYCAPHKLNVAALGNQVPQLHIHIIARTTEDPAWPGPVWGVGTPVAYSPDVLTDTIETFKNTLTA